MARKPSAIDRVALEKVLRNQAMAYLRLPHVKSVGIGTKRQGKVHSSLPCIVFSVEKKITDSVLKKSGMQPLPKQFIDGNGRRIPTDVVERKFRLDYQEVPLPLAGAAASNGPVFRRTRQDPLVPGISVSHARGTAGTLGAIVYDLATQEPLILSNWHVLHGPGREIGDDVSQPGRYDSSDVQANRIGKLVRSHLGRAGDCAVASINRPYLNDQFELGVIPARIARVDKQDKVIKSGRTTAVTRGIVSQPTVFIKMDYGGDVGEVYVKCFEIAMDPAHPPAGGELSLPGDSGSLWMIIGDQVTDIAAGLHLSSAAEAGMSAEFAYACHIEQVLEKLQVTFKKPAS